MGYPDSANTAPDKTYTSTLKQDPLFPGRWIDTAREVKQSLNYGDQVMGSWFNFNFVERLARENGASERQSYWLGFGAMIIMNPRQATASTIGKAGMSIARIVPGSLPAAEEAAVLSSLSHIDAGTVPAGALAKKWGATFKNWAGDLPGASGAASPYLEYRVAPTAGMTGAGTNRIVVNSQTGEMYYTWTHYGDAAMPAFVKIR